MNTLTPFLRHEMDNLPNETHGRADGGILSHCIPSRQKNAIDYLAGNTPGVMQFYAPESADAAAQAKLQSAAPTAFPPSKDLATEDDATVARLVEWREEAPYG